MSRRRSGPTPRHWQPTDRWRADEELRCGPSKPSEFPSRSHMEVYYWRRCDDLVAAIDSFRRYRAHGLPVPEAFLTPGWAMRTFDAGTAELLADYTPPPITIDLGER